MNESRAHPFNEIQVLSLFRVLGCKQNASFAHYECDQLGIYSENIFPTLWTIEFQRHQEKNMLKVWEIFFKLLLLLLLSSLLEDLFKIAVL
jgi:hypothetical protein